MYIRIKFKTSPDWFPQPLALNGTVIGLNRNYNATPWNSTALTQPPRRPLVFEKGTGHRFDESGAFAPAIRPQSPHILLQQYLSKGSFWKAFWFQNTIDIYRECKVSTWKKRENVSKTSRHCSYSSFVNVKSVNNAKKIVCQTCSSIINNVTKFIQYIEQSLFFLFL